MEHADHIPERIIRQGFMKVFGYTVVDVENADGRIRGVLAQQLGDQGITVILAGDRKPVLRHATVDETGYVSQAQLLFGPALSRRPGKLQAIAKIFDHFFVNRGAAAGQKRPTVAQFREAETRPSLISGQ
jgi:hypothetical protein